MEKQIIIQIKDKRATLLSENAEIVCGNSDYTAKFEFADDDFLAYGAKTALFVYGKNATPIVFEGDTCPIPPLADCSFCLIGVIAGDVKTTTGAKVPCVASISDMGDTPLPPTEDVYNQIMEILGKLDPDNAIDEEKIKELIKEVIEQEGIGGGLTEEEVKEIVATETEGKVDKTTLAGTGTADNAGLVYTPSGGWNGINASNGVLTLQPASNSQIDVKKANFAITPTNIDYAVRSVVGKELTDHEKRIENLESTLLTYVEHTATAYEKAVPVGVAPNAILDIVGGASYASKNAFNPALLNDSSNYEITEDGGIRYLKEVTIEGIPPSRDISITLDAGTWYISASGEGNLPSSFEAYDENMYIIGSNSFTIEKRQRITLRWYYEVEGIWEKPFYIMLSQTENAPYEPYFTGLRNAPTTEVISKDTNSNVLQNVPIPTQIQTLAHYGEAYTYIDFDNKQFIDEGDTLVFTGDESFRYYYYNGHGVDVANICKNGKDNVSNFISTEGNKKGSGYGVGNMWCGYQKGTNFHWIGILDILGYTNDWVDKSTPTNEEKANAIAKFKQYVKDRYNSGNPITVRYEILNPVITDVSAYLTDYTDYKKIRVEANGTIVCENTYKYAVPSTLTYVKRKE